MNYVNSFQPEGLWRLEVDFFLDKFVGRVNDKRQANVFIVFYRRKNRKIEVEFF